MKNFSSGVNGRLSGAGEGGGMRFGPRLAALATVLALPLGATVFANALADEGPPSAPGDVRIGSDPSPAGRAATTGQTTPSPTTTAPPAS